jgi:hypothetical protein
MTNIVENQNAAIQDSRHSSSLEDVHMQKLTLSRKTIERHYGISERRAQAKPKSELTGSHPESMGRP